MTICPHAGLPVLSSRRRSCAQIREVAVGAGTRPEPNRALRRGEFQIVDNQARLLGAMDIEAGLAAGQNDLDLGSRARFKIHVGLVKTRRLLARALPWPVGE